MTNLFNQNKLLTVREVALILGVAPSTISGWVYAKMIPNVKFGTGKSALVRFNPIVMNKWVDSLSRMPEVKDRRRVEINFSSKKSGKVKVEDFNKFVDELREAM